jgi:hypothetical protein
MALSQQILKNPGIIRKQCLLTIGVSVQPTRTICSSEAPDIKQKATSGRLRSPSGGLEAAYLATTTTKNILWPFGIFYGHFDIFSRFGNLYQENLATLTPARKNERKRSVAHFSRKSPLREGCCPFSRI